jgi:hypothetical protein
MPAKRAANLLVVQTYLVDGPRGTGISHYELHFAPDDAPDAKRLVILTRESGYYMCAYGAEGTPRRFDITWHPSVRPNGMPCAVLDSMTDTPHRRRKGLFDDD